MEVGLFYHACSDRSGGNGLKLRQEIFRLDNRKGIFTIVGSGIGKVAQGPGGVTIPGGVQRMSGPGTR